MTNIIIKEEPEPDWQRVIDAVATSVSEREHNELRIVELNEELARNRVKIREIAARIADVASVTLDANVEAEFIPMDPKRRRCLEDDKFSNDAQLMRLKLDELNLLDSKTKCLARRDSLPKEHREFRFSRSMDEPSCALRDPILFGDSRNEPFFINRAEALQVVMNTFEAVVFGQTRIPALVSPQGFGDSTFASKLIPALKKFPPVSMTTEFKKEIRNCCTIFLDLCESELVHPRVQDSRLVEHAIDFLREVRGKRIDATFKSLQILIEHEIQARGFYIVFDNLTSAFSHPNLSEDDRNNIFSEFINRVCVPLLSLPKVYILLSGGQGLRLSETFYQTISLPPFTPSDIIKILQRTTRCHGEKLAQILEDRERKMHKATNTLPKPPDNIVESYARRVAEYTCGNPKTVCGIILSYDMKIPNNF